MESLANCAVKTLTGGEFVGSRSGETRGGVSIMKTFGVIALILIEVGAINCGLIGFFDYNFVSVIFGGSAMGDYSILGRIVFAIIGLAGLWGLSFFGRVNCLCDGTGISAGEEIDMPEDDDEE